MNIEIKVVAGAWAQMDPIIIRQFQNLLILFSN